MATILPTNNTTPQNQMPKTKLDPRLVLLKRLFNFTSLMFRHERMRNKISKLRLLIALILAAAMTYKLVYSIYYEATKTKFSSSVLFLLTWELKCVIVVYFVIYWQVAHFNLLFSPKTWEVSTRTSLKPQNFHRRAWKIYAVFSILALFLFGITIFTIYEYYFGDFRIYNLNKATFETFGVNTGVIPILINLFSGLVYFLVLMSYILALSCASEECETFNKQVKMIGQNGENQEEIKSELLVHYDSLINLTDLIKKINSMFEVYVFVIVGGNIIVAVLTMLDVVEIQDIRAKILYVTLIVVIITELFALTMPPAKLSSALKSIEGNLSSNKRIWFPHDEKIYQIAIRIVDHTKQEGLGISLWGYATMSKSKILTIASLILTYVTLLIQMMPSDENVKQSST